MYAVWSLSVIPFQRVCVHTNNTIALNIFHVINLFVFILFSGSECVSVPTISQLFVGMFVFALNYYSIFHFAYSNESQSEGFFFILSSTKKINDWLLWFVWLGCLSLSRSLVCRLFNSMHITWNVCVCLFQHIHICVCLTIKTHSISFGNE